MTLGELFTQWLAAQNETIVVKVSADRKEQLVAWLAANGFEYSV
jgi:aryl-alcohol dehydrogenase-like predicted oxidoreductase